MSGWLGGLSSGPVFGFVLLVLVVGVGLVGAALEDRVTRRERR